MLSPEFYVEVQHPRRWMMDCWASTVSWLTAAEDVGVGKGSVMRDFPQPLGEQLETGCVAHLPASWPSTEGYGIIWVRPSSKMACDEQSRHERIAKAVAARRVGFKVIETQQEHYRQEKRGWPGKDACHRKTARTHHRIMMKPKSPTTPPATGGSR